MRRTQSIAERRMHQDAQQAFARNPHLSKYGSAEELKRQLNPNRAIQEWEARYQRDQRAEQTTATEGRRRAAKQLSSAKSSRERETKAYDKSLNRAKGLWTHIKKKYSARRSNIDDRFVKSHLNDLVMDDVETMLLHPEQVGDKNLLEAVKKVGHSYGLYNVRPMPKPGGFQASEADKETIRQVASKPLKAFDAWVEGNPGASKEDKRAHMYQLLTKEALGLGMDPKAAGQLADAIIKGRVSSDGR